MKKYAHGTKYEADKTHINKYKMAHMIGVAEYMRRHAYKYGLNPDLMYMLGLLHDIGYLRGRNNHEETGAALVHQIFDKDNTASMVDFEFAILNHGTDPYEIERMYEGNIRTSYPALFLLYEADMSIGINGFNIGFKERLKDIKERYGEDSEAYYTASNTVDYVVNHMYDYTTKYGDIVSEGLMLKAPNKKVYIVYKIYCDNIYIREVLFTDGTWGTIGKDIIYKKDEFNRADFDLY